ncbi:MAG: DUF86 domain-containing protein [Chloroflexota bacterium]
MKKDDTVYLQHILDAIHRIESYTQGVLKEKYLEDGLLQDGVVRQLEIIGQASVNLSDEFQEEHSYIPWGQIIGLRNRIVHAYFNINLDITWDIVQVDIPTLKRQIESILF